MMNEPRDNEPVNDASGDEPSAVATPLSTSARVTLALAAVIVPAALAVAAYALLRHGPSPMRTAQLPARFQLDLNQQFDIPKTMIGYIERDPIPLSLAKPRALAAAADGRIYVAGDQTIQVLDPSGESVKEIELEIEPTCVAVAPGDAKEPGRLYIGTAQGVLLYGQDGSAQGAWPALDEKSELTAISVSFDEVFVADAGHRIVLRYASDGQLLGQIGAPSDDRQMPGFVIPSPYFDLVVGPDMFLYVVNPGMRRIECYTFDGQLQGFWGHAGSGLTDFFGCCNPAHLARLPDGRFVTSEKGIPRIKVFNELGDFVTVVAGPAELGVSRSTVGDARGNQVHPIFDVATGPNGEVFALDAQKRSVRVFVPKSDNTAAAGNDGGADQNAPVPKSSASPTNKKRAAETSQIREKSKS